MLNAIGDSDMTKKFIELRVYFKDDVNMISGEIQEIASELQDHVIDMLGGDEAPKVFTQDVTYQIYDLSADSAWDAAKKWRF